MKLAQALNDEGVEAGLEEGRVYLVNDLGDEPETVGEYTVAQTNSGPDVRLDDKGRLCVVAFSEGKQHSATQDPQTHQWV